MVGVYLNVMTLEVGTKLSAGQELGVSHFFDNRISGFSSPEDMTDIINR